MRGQIISYLEMCRREGVSLQRGMNFRLNGRHSVVLMSVREDAPYADRIEKDGMVLIYEGHDILRRKRGPDPKSVDQPERFASGKLTENGKFAAAAREYRDGKKEADIVRVYEKIRDGIWNDNGYFRLVDFRRESDGRRQVFKFELFAVESDRDDLSSVEKNHLPDSRQRLIPASVKLEVWKRDEGKCVKCGANDELHFDHIVPFSRGGTSLSSSNVQLLCMRHNLQKSAKIE